MKDTETFFMKIAESVKQRLCRHIGRSYILPHEWFWLMKDNFPFKPPREILTICPMAPVEISCLDNSSMVDILKQKFGYLPYISLLLRRKDLEDYAWKIVMDSICSVYGG